MSNHDKSWPWLVDETAEPSAIHNPPGEAKPQLNKPSDKSDETGSQATAKEIGNILPDEPSSATALDKFGIVKGKPTSTSVEAIASGAGTC
jgi:hypothetical protein